jgi:hypothetical protein
MLQIGAVCFGIVIGWVTYRTLRYKAGSTGIADIAAVLGAVGGATVTAHYQGELFGLYSIGLLIGFVSYFLVGLKVQGKGPVGGWMD